MDTGKFKDHQNDHSFYVGQRLSYDGFLCTVRYFGPLENTTGLWLGVEWDESTRGKHSGQFNGKAIFQCRSFSPTAGSFIRPTRVPDNQRVFLEALRFKYESGGSKSTRRGATARFQNGDSIEISGKVVEEVGFEKIRREQAALANLRIAILDGLNICGLTGRNGSQSSRTDAQLELSKRCPSVQQLDLGRNPLETWADVATICAPLEKINVLRARYLYHGDCRRVTDLISGLRLRDISLAVLPSDVSPFKHVQELDLNECLLTTDQVSEP